MNIDVNVAGVVCTAGTVGKKEEEGSRITREAIFSSCCAVAAGTCPLFIHALIGRVKGVLRISECYLVIH